MTAHPPQTGHGDDRRYLDLAARIAIRAEGLVEPNPLVGAVLVKDGRTIGLGHHRVFGGPHAEREALQSARDHGHDPAGGTMYVTLEPCRHTGKTPPCVDALIEARVARVVYARADPGPESGGGASVLRDAGIECVRSGASEAAVRISDPFVHRVRTGRPWVIAKWAQTIDGRIATRTGESKWISGDRSRARVHRLRARVDAILTGLGTVRADDPMLNARGVRTLRRRAARVVIDPELEIDPGSRLVQTASDHPTVVACSKDLVVSGITDRVRTQLEAGGVEIMGVPEDPDQPGRLRLEMLLRALMERRGVSTVLTEAGAGLLGALLEADLIDEALVYVAPMLLGDDRALAAATGRIAEHLSAGRRLRLVRIKRVADDVELVYRREMTD
ncbi:MAG: bifunctional diaminohydroxyphosphoribosylaminopyrimidine deaminase/5-amino-6-(5-phosphoribosylamino)uracil reductase RibD [Planctomycetota bacterium]